jgi:hypothetical protein
MTVRAGMEAWRDIRQHPRSPNKIVHLETKMITMWTTGNLFASFQGSVKWNLTCPPSFLPEVLATFNIQSMQLLRHSPSPDIEEENITICEETLGNCHRYPFIRCSSYLAPILFPAVQFGALCH